MNVNKMKVNKTNDAETILEQSISKSNVSPICVITNQNSVRFIRAMKYYLPRIFVRAEDFLSANGKGFLKIYYEVVNAGGINAYLGIPNPVVLSLIMSDLKCQGISPSIVSEMLVELKITCCTTFDGPTYLGEKVNSAKTIEKIQRDNHILIKQNPDCKFLGVVKGCTEEQIRCHAMQLLDEGISELIFHAGDYVSRASNIEIETAAKFIHLLHSMAETLSVYGIGSKSMIRKFHEADNLITLNQVIEPYYGIFTNESGRKCCRHHYVAGCNLSLWISGNDTVDLCGYNTFARICHDFINRHGHLSVQMKLDVFLPAECNAPSELPLSMEVL